MHRGWSFSTADLMRGGDEHRRSEGQGDAGFHRPIPWARSVAAGPARAPTRAGAERGAEPRIGQAIGWTVAHASLGFYGFQRVGTQLRAAVLMASRKNPMANGRDRCPSPGLGFLRLMILMANGKTASASTPDNASPTSRSRVVEDGRGCSPDCPGAARREGPWLSAAGETVPKAKACCGDPKAICRDAIPKVRSSQQAQLPRQWVS